MIPAITRTFKQGFLLVFLLLVRGAFAQNYPVTCTPIVQPKFSLKWSEISTSNDMFKVHLLLKDLTKPSVDAYLKIRLSGVGVDIRTVDGFIPSQTIKLIPGQPVMLTANDLAEYFNISNLVVDGIDISALYAGGRLPEGLYTWTVEAYEIDRNRQVSNTGMALMNVFKNYPPIINIPQDGAILPVTTPQNVLFSWTSRSTASLNAAQGKTYKLRIYPLEGDDDPNMVTNSGIQPIEITTNTPYFSYGAGNIPLEKGKRYAVQVQEEDANGADEYENEGKSQVVTFSFGKPCVAPEGMVINPIGKGRVEIAPPAPDGGALDGEIYPITAWYKQKDASIWNSVPFNGNSVVISGLKDKTDYEFKLSSACGDNTNTMTALRAGAIVPTGDPSTEPETFKIDDSEFDEEEPEILDPAILDPYGIGIELNADGTPRPVETLEGIFSKIIKPECVTNADAYVECSPNHPEPRAITGTIELDALAIGDVLGIYDYTVLVTAVGGGTSLSGKGLVKLPFLENSYMAVEFSGIKAKKGEAGTQGGCVYYVPDSPLGGGGFRTRPISQADLQNEQVKTIADIIKLTEPTVFHGDLEVAIKKYQEKGIEIASKGTATPQDKQDLLTYTKGIETAVGTWKDKFTEVFGSGTTDPKIAEILGDMTAILTQLNADKQTIEAGTTYPTIPDLKAKMDAIIEKIKALQQENTPKPPRIQNVLATNIGYDNATLTWQGDPRFTKYVINYKTADGGELQETVSGNRLDLKKLQKNSQYGFKIEGYVGDEVLDTYVKGNFKTLDNILPPPTNLRYEVLSDNSVKVLWDKDSKHKSFKFIYKGKDGILYTIPNIDAKNPSIILKDLDPTQIYSYEVIGLNNNLVSNGANGVLTSALCTVTIEVTDFIGGLKKIEAFCSGTISWYNGGNDIGVLANNVPVIRNSVSWADGQTVMSSSDGKTIFPSDNISKSYTALCTVTDPNDATKTKSCTVSTEVLARCPEFTISASQTLIENEGEVVSLSASGCSGQVIWANGLGEGLNVKFVPNASMQIKAFCQSASKTCKSNNISIDYQLQACSQLKLYLTEGEYTRGEILPWNDSRYFKVSLKGCSSEANWSITGAGGWRPWNWTKPKITKSDNTGCTVEHARKDTKITVACGECPPTSITVEDNSECDGLKLESTILTPMVASVRAKEFNDISEQLFSLSDGVKTYNFSNEIRVGLTNQAQVFDATFKNGCKVSLEIPPYKFGIKIHVFNNDYGRSYETFSGVKYDASLLKAQMPYLVYGINGSVTEKPLSDLIISPTVAGCTGNIVWTNNLDASFAYRTDELKFRNIETAIYSAKITELPFPAVSTIYYATCKGSNDVSYPSNAAEIIISSTTCIQISAPTTIPYKGDKIKLIANGCKGTIKWNTGETTPIIEPIITAKTTYQVSCSSPVCVENVSIDAKEMEISASKNKALIDEIVTLKIVGCQGGTISWNTGQNGSTTNVRPIETTTYTADCMANGIKISTKSITITVDQNIPPLPCIDFKIKADKGTLVRCVDNTITLTAIGCTNGKVTWSSGTPSDDGMTNKLTLQNPTTINATCKIAGFDPVSSSKKIVGEDINLTVPIQEVEKNIQSTLTVQGCVNYDCSPGEVFWQTSDNPSQRGQSIRVFLDKPTTYKIYCATQNGAGGQIDVTINIKAKEDPFTSGTTPPVCNVELIAWARVRDGQEGASQQDAIPFTPKKCLNLQTYNGHTLNQDGGPLYYISFTPDSQYPAGSITPITGGNLVFDSGSKEGIYKFTGYVLDASGKTLLCKTPELKFEICSSGSSGGSGSCDAFAGNSFEKRIYFDPYDEDRGPAVLGRTLDRRIGKNGEQCEVVKWYEGDSKEELFQVDNTVPVHEVKLDATVRSTTYRYKCVSCDNREGTLTYINEAIPERNGGRIADAATTTETNATLPCNDPMPLESAIANYLSFHICNDINTMKDDAGNFSDAKILNFLQQTITAMKADPKFANVVFPNDLSGVVAAIKQSDCITAGELLSKGTSGTISKTDYTNTAKDYTELNKKILNATKPTLTATTITPASCGLNNGSVKLSATSGTPPYQYSKDNISYQSSDIFDALAVGKYTFYVKDARGAIGTVVVEVKNSLDGIEQATIALANARAASIYDLGEITVQWNTTSKAYKFMFIKGVKGTYAGNNLEITEVPKGVNVQLGKYKGIFNAKNYNEFFGFYLDGYTGKCTPSDISIKKGTDCKILCTEGFLPPYIYDTDNTDLVKLFINKYKGQETDPNYTLTLALIKKLEPLGLVKQSDEYPFLSLSLVNVLKSLQAVDNALNANLSTLQNIIATGDRCALLYTLWELNQVNPDDAVLTKLSLSDRKLALKKLADGGLTSGTDFLPFWCHTGNNGGEESVLRLLKTTPLSNQKEVLDYMTSQELTSFSVPNLHNSILSAFEYRMNGDNYDSYMAIMIQWSNDNYPTQYPDFNSIINHVKTPKNIFYLGPTTQSYTKKFIYEQGGKTYIHFDVVKDGLSIIRENVEVNDRVFVYFDKNFTYGTDTFEAGKSYEIPALLCYHIMELMDRRVYEMKKSIVTNGLLIAFGIGEIRAATGLWDLGVALGMIDMGIGVSGIVMDAGLAQQLSLTPKGREYLEYYHKFVLIYGAARLVSDLTGLTQMLRTEATAINDARVLTFTDEITLKYLNKWYPEVYTGIKDFDLATQRRFFNDFLNLPNAETVLGGLELSPNRVAVWKSFENETFLSGQMRDRYIRDLGVIVDENIVVVEQMVAFRKQLQQVYTNLGLDFSAIAEKNIAFAKIEYEINGVKKTIDNILSISGRATPAEANVGAIATATGKTITPTASTNRFFAISGGGQDSEAKIFEYFMERLAREKGIVIPNGADRSQYVEQILSGSNVKISIVTEMSPCPSCAGIIETFNGNNSGAKATAIHGIIYP